MLGADPYSGVNRLHDYGTIIRNTANCGVHCFTVAAPDRDDQIRIRRIHGHRESSPIHECFFHVLLSGSILVGIRRRNACVRVNHDQHGPSFENVFRQNLFLVFRGCQRNQK